MSFHYEILKDFSKEINNFSLVESNFASRSKLLNQHKELITFKRQVKDKQWLDELTRLNSSISIVQTEQQNFISQLQKKLERATSVQERASLLPLVYQQTQFDLNIGRKYYQTEAIDELFQSILDMSEEDHIGKEIMPDNLVHHEISPAGLVLELLSHNDFTNHKVVYDVGCGTGFVSLLLALFGGENIEVKAVDLQDDLVSHGENIARQFGIKNIQFFSSSILDVDLSDADFLYLFSPFYGEVMRNFLDLLQKQATKRTITIASFGESSNILAKMDFLTLINTKQATPFKLCIFESNLL